MCKPKIRFKGCQGEWERKKLGEISEKTQNINWKETNRAYKYIDLTSVDLQFHNIGQTITIEADNAPSRAQQIVLKGDIIFATTRPTQMRVCRIDEEYDGQICSTGYCVIRPKGGLISSEWLIQVLSTDSFKNYLELNQTTGNYPSISNKLLLEFAVPIPTLPEQRQIAAYFRSLDGILSGCEARLSSLRRLKEGALQAFFPQQGETQPKIRFKGCQGEWVKKELSECLEISDERNLDGRYKRDDVLSVSDDYGVVNQIELLGRSYAGKTLTNYDVLRTGQIVYTKSPLRSKPYGIVKLNTGKPGIVSSLYAVYNAKPNISADYLHWYFDPAWRLNAYIRPLVNKGAKNTMNISDETALTGYIYIPPTLAEQRLIANFFRTLDLRIELERQRLEKLKQLKAACLEKMFV